MCGIWGFIGATKQTDALTHAVLGAARRGPHGYGVAYHGGGELKDFKTTAILSKDVQRVLSLDTTHLIGNSRLSTYGSYEDLRDFHPHFNTDRSVGIVHNGNVRNYKELLLEFGFQLLSDCDSEVIAHLADQYEGDLLDKLAKAVKKISHVSPLAVLGINQDSLVAIRRGHPLYIHEESDSLYLCSREMPNSELLEDHKAYMFTLKKSNINKQYITLRTEAP